MTWHLKDKELEKKLIAIDPDFIDNLNNSVEYHKGNITVETGFGDGIGGLSRFSAEFRLDELEDIPEYNPDDWNEYPAVTPPEGVWMRVEAMREDCVVMHLSFLFENGVWVDENGTTFNLTKSMCARFRPWEN